MPLKITEIRTKYGQIVHVGSSDIRLGNFGVMLTAEADLFLENVEGILIYFNDI